LLMDALGRREPAFVRLEDHPRALVFSPSGHRIYVARRTEPGLAVIDRYDRTEIDGVALPTPAATIRLDPLGRWLLARPTVGDSAATARRSRTGRPRPVSRAPEEGQREERHRATRSSGAKGCCTCRCPRRRTKLGRPRWPSSSRAPGWPRACSSRTAPTTVTELFWAHTRPARRRRRSGGSSAGHIGSINRRHERTTAAALAPRQ